MRKCFVMQLHPLAEEEYRWWDHMADLMEVNEDRSQRVVELRELFHLEAMNSNEQQ